MGEGIVAEFGTDTYMCAKSFQSCLTLCNPMDCSPPGSSVHGILQARILEWVTVLFSRRSSPPRDQTRSPTLQADSLPAELQGKPKNTGVYSLSLLQQIVLAQESKRGLLHCRWIPYQLSYQGRLIDLVSLPNLRPFKILCRRYSLIVSLQESLVTPQIFIEWLPCVSSVNISGREKKLIRKQVNNYRLQML